MEVATQLAEALDISLDYLVGATELELDQATMNRLQEIAKLFPKEKELVYEFLDAFITKSKSAAVMQ